MKVKNYLTILSVAFIVILFFAAPPTYAQQQLDEAFTKALEYRNIGPTRGGRATAVSGDPTNDGVFYMGSTGGGVWKTTDFGFNWSNISDGYFKSPSIGAIRLAPTNSNIVYVGTGSDGIRSNVIAGKGVYRSNDAGKTWKHIGLEQTGQIGAIEIHPDDPNTVYVAAIGQAFSANEERGVYRTKDGGENWEKILYLSDTTGAVDLEFAPGNPNIIYASMWRGERKPWTIISGGKEGGIYKTTDGGDNWKKITAGLPAPIFGKSDLAVSAADPNRVYALVEAPEDKKQGGLYVSNDQGESFSLVSTYAPLLDRPFYYCNVDADPKNPDIVFVNSTRFFKSENGGKNWSRLSTPHGDNHEIWIHPDNTNLWVQANDGGVNITRDGGKNWSSQLNQSTAELYQVEIDDQFPYWLYAGQQDNFTTIAMPSLPPYRSATNGISYLMATGGCETGPAVPKPGNPDIIYANCKGRFSVFNKKTGQEQQYYVGASNMYGHNPKELKFRFQRVAPIHVSPHDPDVVYHTSQFVHKTTDDGKTWEIISPDLTAFENDKQVISGSPITRDITGEEFYSTIYAIQESKISKGLIWVGANDGPVHVTKNGGQDWTNVTPAAMKQGGRIDCVEPSPHNAAKAYACGLRYQLGDWKPYIYKTENYGQSWTLITDGSNGIPADYPVRVVREDPNREGVLYAGTEYGLFISMDDGANWMPFQQNLPITPITDIKVHQKDLVLSTMGRGFWILDDLSPIQQMTTEVQNTAKHLYVPRDAHRMRYRGTGQNAIPYYPRASVLIHYHLNSDISDEIVMDILNKDKKVIRSFSNKRNIDDRNNIPEPDMATGFYKQGFNSSLKSSKGLHRVSWDMRHSGSWNGNPRRVGSGPMVAPGKYYVRFKIGGKEMMQSFNILPDPRVIQSGVSIEDMIAQEELSLKVRNLQSQANQLMNKVGKVNRVTRSKAKAEMANMIKRNLQTAEGRYMKPKLMAQLRYLSSMLDRADQAPGKDAYDRYGELDKELQALVSKWESVSENRTDEE